MIWGQDGVTMRSIWGQYGVHMGQHGAIWGCYGVTWGDMGLIWGAMGSVRGAMGWMWVSVRSLWIPMLFPDLPAGGALGPFGGSAADVITGRKRPCVAPEGRGCGEGAGPHWVVFAPGGGAKPGGWGFKRAVFAPIWPPVGHQLATSSTHWPPVGHQFNPLATSRSHRPLWEAKWWAELREQAWPYDRKWAFPRKAPPLHFRQLSHYRCSAPITAMAPRPHPSPNAAPGLAVGDEGVRVYILRWDTPLA